MRSLKVAAIQATSENGCIARNLTNAEPLVRSAAEQGAELIVCPEFFATGYEFHQRIWKSAEPAGGATEEWLARLGRTHAVTIGAGFLEAEGEHFWNTFSLFGPNGQLLGRVRKAALPFFEAWYFRSCNGPKCIETDFGRIAVGICFENYTTSFLNSLARDKPDLILMPHSAPTPYIPFISGMLRRTFHEQLRSVPANYAKILGVPVVLANKVSFSKVATPIPILPGIKAPGHYRGLSSIWDSNGVNQGELMDAEDALVADVALNPAMKQNYEPTEQGYLAFGPPVVGAAVAPVMKLLAGIGHHVYERSKKRVTAAKRITDTAH